LEFLLGDEVVHGVLEEVLRDEFVRHGSSSDGFGGGDGGWDVAADFWARGGRGFGSGSASGRA
jgi:hypothetical protein